MRGWIRTGKTRAAKAVKACLDAIHNSVRIFEKRSEVLVKRLDDIRQPVKLGLRPPPTSARRYRPDLRLLIRKRYLDHGAFLNPVAIHVD